MKMKKYIDYLREFNEEELMKGLLGFGLFADKLPGLFSSLAFYDYCKEKEFPMFEKGGRDYVRYETTRNINIPRALSIPSPFAYSNLCKCIVDNWKDILNVIDEKTKKQTYKVSQIHIQKLKGKDVLFEMSHSYEDKDKELVRCIQKVPITNRFRVEADISSCFPSIYSHALSWALVGKKTAKASKDDKAKWYNILDFYSRSIKNDETNGLLIGPHTSNLLSEIVLCCVDERLSKRYNYVRNIDDYVCYVRTESDAERFLLDLNDALREYELSLNAKKTKVLRLPLSSETNWVDSLNTFFIGDIYDESGKVVFLKQRLKAYLDLAITLANNSGNSAVYTYAIKTISETCLGKSAEGYYIDIIHHLLCLYPYLVHWMEDYVFDTFHVGKERIKEISKDLYETGNERHIYEACTFALYWSLKYDFSFDVDYASESIKSSDCLFMLLAYLKAKRSKNKDAIKKLKLKAKELCCDMDRYWIFIYEVLPKDELPPGEFRGIKGKKVSFIKKEFL